MPNMPNMPPLSAFPRAVSHHDLGGSLLAVTDRLAEDAPVPLPQRLQDHLPVAEAAAAKNIERTKATGATALFLLERQLNETLSARVPAKNRLLRIRFLAAEWSQVMSKHSACTKKCSHCCHLDTAVPRAEAVLMSKQLGIALTEPAEPQGIEGTHKRADYFGQPCTFLNEGECSIYAHRPLVCRTLVNMDDTNLLCELHPGVAIPVPYANSTRLQSAMALLHIDDNWADIREWFPAQPATR